MADFVAMVNEMQALADYVDITKMDKAKVKSAIALAADGMKPTTKFLLDLDDTMWDQLKNVAIIFIDKLGVQDIHPTVGDVNYSVADVETYLKGFQGVDNKVRTKLRSNPKLLNRLKNDFTEAEQAKLVGNPFLIALLSAFGPLIIEWIKNWLSK